jgi:hypothetical protein
MKRWSKLQKEIEQLFAEGLDLRVQCRAYRMASQRGSTDLPRYWVMLDKVVIWDYPRDFGNLAKDYPYLTEIGAISDLIRDYIDTPIEQLLIKSFNDRWHLIEIFLAADRRIGRRKLEQLREQLNHPGARAVLTARWGSNVAPQAAALPGP